MSDNLKSKDLQKAFAAHIRNPRRFPKPAGINEHRMQVYRDLFFNNISKLIAQAFPVLASLFNSDEWHHLIRSFYQSEHNKTPYFTEIAGEFVDFLNKQPVDEKRPFIEELAYYEWLELSLEKSQQQPLFHEVNVSRLLSQAPIISPVLNAHSYQFPVHQIGPDFQPTTTAKPSHLIVWRDRHYTIHFAELNQASLNLLRQLQHTDLTGREAILSVFAQNVISSEDKIIEFGQQQLLKWAQQDIIINTQ